MASEALEDHSALYYFYNFLDTSKDFPSTSSNINKFRYRYIARGFAVSRISSVVGFDVDMVLELIINHN